MYINVLFWGIPDILFAFNYIKINRGYKPATAIVPILNMDFIPFFL